MTQIMTAPKSGMTEGQIENAVGKLRDAMRKHRDEISSDVAQQVLGVDNLGMLMFAPFRKRAEALSNLIVRKVKVNRSRSPQEALDATGRVQYTNRKVVDNMPKAAADEVDIWFFKPGPSVYRNGYISDDDLAHEFERHGFKPVDPISLAAADPDFAVGTHWKDADGKWNFATFNHWGDERRVIVDRGVSGWDGSWRFAGVRK